MSDAQDKYANAFTPGKNIWPSLIFEKEARAYMSGATYSVTRLD